MCDPLNPQVEGTTSQSADDRLSAASLSEYMKVVSDQSSVPSEELHISSLNPGPVVSFHAVPPFEQLPTSQAPELHMYALVSVKCFAKA